MAPGDSTQRRKVALITGATGGIGKASAIALAKTEEYDLALHYYAASQESRDDLAASITSATNPQASNNVKIHFFQADMSDFDSVRTLHREVVQQLGPIDVLFNNAGTKGVSENVTDLANVSMEVFETSWRVNTGSPILLTQLCLPHMEKQGWGRVIFNSSVAAFTGGVVGPHYASSKAALHGFIHWLAARVAKKGITVNGIAPALIGDTGMMGRADDEGTKKIAEANIPVGRLGRPEEIAETVMWMIKTGYVTNKVISVDGGWYAY